MTRQRIVVDQIPDEVWALATWEGSRREQIRRALRLTIRERLQTAEELSDLSRAFQQMRADGRFKAASSGRSD